MPPFRRLQRVRHEPKKRDVTVIRRRLISPQFLSLTFSGEDLNSFISDGFDDHIKFMFTDSNGNAIRRDHTPRHFDANALELTIEFALHGNGLACEWAQRAEVGSRAQIGGPRGSMIVPLDFDWHLFITDASGMPAVHRRLEELPAVTQAIAMLTVDAVDRRCFTTAAELHLSWFDSTDGLVKAIEALNLPAGDGFDWGAGEASMMKHVRRLLVEDKGHSKDAMRIAA